MRKRKIYSVGVLLFFFINTAVSQSQLLKGKVVDGDDGTPIFGATISAKGSGTTSLTDQEGNFEIIPSSSTKSLIVSFVGYITVEVSVADDLSYIQLKSNESSLTEVVVVGFGTKLKKDLTGNIARIKAEEIKDLPVPNFLQGVQGRAPGVFIESESGRVGGGIKVRVRGAGSINATNEPLYVIDGVPLNTETNRGNALADINFNDVESFDILKDASAAAIYGSRAANGVVLITTKKGKSGKTRFDVDLLHGFNSPTGYRGFLNAAEYIELFTEAAVNDAKYYWNRNNEKALADGFISEQDVVDYNVGVVEGRFDRYSGHSDWRSGETDTDWERLAFNSKAQSTTANVTASGGNEKTRFYFGGSYSDQDGILIGNTFRRLSGRLNLDHEVSKVFKLGANLSVAQTQLGVIADDNAFTTPMQIVALSPITPVRNENGELYDRPVTTYYNPLLDFEGTINKAVGIRSLSTVYGQLNFTKNFSFRSELGADLYNQNRNAYYGTKTYTGGGTTGGAGLSRWFKTVNLNTNNYFNYHTTVASAHELDVVLGTSFQKVTTDEAFVEGEGFPLDDLNTLASAGQITGGSSTQTNYTFLSYFSRINYKFDDRFIVNLSGRIDGSSRFGKDSRYGFFPAVSAGWILSNESFLKESKHLSFLKLRASYGLTGTADGIGDFPQLGLWGASKYNLLSGLVSSQLPNPDLRWEQSRQTDIGIDFGFLKNRISGELDYYIRKTTDLLYDMPVPGTTGFVTQFQNVGSMENKGVELMLNASIIEGRNFRWSVGGNISWNQNKIIKLDGDTDTLPGNDGRFMNSLIVGQPIGVFYGPKYAGVDPSNGDALYFLSDDKTTTNDYNAAGYFVVGTPNPKYIYGFNTALSFKGIELNVLFQGVAGNSIQNGAGGFMSANGDWFDNQTADQLRRWQNVGDITDVPQARLAWLGNPSNGISSSSRYVEDGSYLRLKTLTLSYLLPGTVLESIKLRSVKFFVSGQNLLTFTNYTGWDPEVNANYRPGSKNQGSDFYAAPQIKTISFGVNVGI